MRPLAKFAAEFEEISEPKRSSELEHQKFRYLCSVGRSMAPCARMRAGFDFRLSLPSARFRRSIGAWAGLPVDPQGRLIPKEQFHQRLADWTPSEDDKAFVRSLQQRVAEPGKMAAWIAPPERGINNLPVDYEYVKLR